MMIDEGWTHIDYVLRERDDVIIPVCLLIIDAYVSRFRFLDLVFRFGCCKATMSATPIRNASAASSFFLSSSTNHVAQALCVAFRAALD